MLANKACTRRRATSAIFGQVRRRGAGNASRWQASKGNGMQSQTNMFNLQPKASHPKRVIRTTYTDERDLLNDILFLYNHGEGVDVDPCYSVGRFWKGLPQPKYKFDLAPQLPEVQQADCTNLPLEPGQVKSIMFDPPFVTYPSDTSIITNRFSAFKTLDDLKNMYIESLSEFYRVLKNKGLLIFKCQDLVHNHKQFLTHTFVINRAEMEGFFCHDCIILIRDNVLLSPHIQKQQHARKTHSYYLVFSKGLPTTRALDGGTAAEI